MAHEIPLADVIQELRCELQTAIETGDGQSLRFEVQDLELEVQVVVSQEAGGKSGGGFKLSFGILSADASGEVAGKYASSQIQRVKLKLRPKGKDGETTLLSTSGTSFKLPE